MSDATTSVPIASLARVIRSKNAGPFQFTIDLLFPDRETFDLVRAAGVIDRQTVARLYRIPLDRVEGVYFWDAARAVKVTIDRAVSAGAPGDLDCYGAQQHVPLLSIRIPVAATDGGQRATVSKARGRERSAA